MKSSEFGVNGRICVVGLANEPPNVVVHPIDTGRLGRTAVVDRLVDRRAFAIGADEVGGFWDSIHIFSVRAAPGTWGLPIS